MSATDTAAARPDLSGYGWRDRVRAAVAETQGWIVRMADEEDVPYYAPGDLIGLPPDWREKEAFFRCLLGDDPLPTSPETADWARLPAYLTDPGAWGALMERERIDVLAPSSGTDSWSAAAVLGDEGWICGDSPGEAVALAVLAKHSHPDLPRLLAERPK